MSENDNSRPLMDDSGRKTTSHIEGVGRPAGFFAQPSALIAYLLILNPFYPILMP